MDHEQVQPSYSATGIHEYMWRISHCGSTKPTRTRLRSATSARATAMKVAAAATTRARPCEDDTVEFVVLDDSDHRPKGRRRLPPTSTPTVRAALGQRRRVTTVRRLLPVRRNSIKSTSTAATAMITHTHGSMTRLLPLNPTLTPDGLPAHPAISPSSYGPSVPGQPSGIGREGRPRAHRRRVVARRT
jgi:hypothetical protein